MKTIKTPLIFSLIICAAAISVPAFANSSESSPETTAEWVLKDAAFIAPLRDQDPNLTQQLDFGTFSNFNQEFDIRSFKYPLMGPVNLAVQKDYQQVLAMNNAVHANKIVYQTPEDSPYSLSPYRVSTTATAEVKVKF